MVGATSAGAVAVEGAGEGLTGDEGADDGLGCTVGDGGAGTAVMMMAGSGSGLAAVEANVTTSQPVSRPTSTARAIRPTVRIALFTMATTPLS